MGWRVERELELPEKDPKAEGQFELLILRPECAQVPAMGTWDRALDSSSISDTATTFPASGA